MATSLSDLELAHRSPADVEDVSVDRHLVLKHQMGNPDAYAEIFERFRPLTERICYRILGNRDDAQEAVQETMLRVLRGLETFNGRYQLQAWIARIATNVSLDMVRSRARRPQAGADAHELAETHADDDMDPEVIVSRILEQERVRAVLEDIPEHHREVLVLREFEGRSHEEIAGTMGVSPAQAKALIHRAKGTFRRAWTEDRNGIAAFLPWFLVPSLLRRLAGAAQGAGARTVAAGASEVTASTAERVTAAAVAVMVAGTVGVGAVAIRRAHHAPARPSIAATSPVAPTVQPVVAAIAPLPEPAQKRNLAKHRRKPVTPVVVVAEGTAESGESPAPTPEPSGSPDPTPAPAPPPIGPAPAWGMTFTAGITASGSCADCPASPSLVSSEVSGVPGQSITLAQVAQATALDSSGRPAWKLYLEYWGSAEATAGHLQYQFKLDTAGGWLSYSGVATLNAEVATAEGGYLYTFMGGYQLLGASGSEVVPQQGSMQVQLRFWPDGTLYATDITLFEV